MNQLKASVKKQKGSSHAILVIVLVSIIIGALTFLFIRGLSSKNNSSLNDPSVSTLSSVRTLIAKNTAGFNKQTSDGSQSMMDIENDHFSNDKFYMLVNERKEYDSVNGSVYEVDRSGNTNLVIDKDAPGIPKQIKSDSFYNFFSDLSVNEQGELFVSQNVDDKTGNILKIDTNSKTASLIYANDENISGFTHSGNKLFIQNDRSINIVNLIDNSVKKIDGEALIGLNNQITQGPDGSALVLSEGSSYVVRLDADGTVKKVLGGSKINDVSAVCVIECLSGPRQISKDESGNLYILRPAGYAIAREGKATGMGGGLLSYSLKSNKISDISFSGDAKTVMSSAGIELISVANDGKSFYVVDNSLRALHVFSR